MWWLLKLAWRTGTRVRRALARLGSPKWIMGAELDTTEAPPRANLADYLEGQPPAVVADLRGLVRAYDGTFCGKCGAGPNAPELRCADCLQLLVRMVAARGGDARRLGEIAALVRAGRR